MKKEWIIIYEEEVENIEYEETISEIIKRIFWFSMKSENNIFK